MAGTRAENVYLAKLVEQAERYEEMVEFMEKVIGAVATEGEERNLLSVAYKNVVGHRASWRIVSSIELKEESRRNKARVVSIRDYRAKIEAELTSTCGGILSLPEEKLVPSAFSSDSKIFYLEMRGDYNRYLAEFKTGFDRRDAAESTLNAYKSTRILLQLRCRPHM
ncbi:hypothetical protein Cni_G16875 [Canna indica]|uniref:14-3-3 domain-containing protein n=1 Tax=Canna indica TaxID=4628 RepID=A0AAQ3KJK2_9LILI|nr:hypothetical protein Cni_G16875 [Canna indica]